MMRRRLSQALALLAAAATGCTATVDGVEPVGGATVSEIAQERFVRRLHLDLTSTPPAAGYLSDALATLADQGDRPSVRGDLADALMAGQSFADTWVSELENRVFGGDTLDGTFDFYCSILRGNVPECMACGPPPGADPCAACACAQLATLAAERVVLAAASADLHDGAVTPGALERRYAGSYIIRYFFNDAGTAAAALFDLFLGRPAEPDELANAASMVIGSLLGPDAPAGLLVHRHGSDFDDLVDIVFSSEVYREAAVAGVFLRYLGRLPEPAEQRHFTDGLDPEQPDLRPVIRAVVSSQEYFEQ